MPDQNIPHDAAAARRAAHAAENKWMIIKIYCTIALVDLVVLGLFPSWLVANSLAVVSALLYLGIYRYRAYILHPEAQEADPIELREGVVHNMVMEYMGGDGESRVDDAERFEDAEDSNDDDDGEDEHENHGEEPEEVHIEEVTADDTRSTQINIHIHRGGSMYINMMQGGTLLANVFGEVEGLE
ncbi:uncharacterized protein J4E87_007094 [Alternaria ethzedia]|uniref:uncharacterized protein n=1 Tax=Alternaria ethzedia TaxID=181014 RepID=UPI0020C3A0E3|nr:uncharacterized protein J4E87_007094 [Alternaria ethzedia]KAI4620766.1 hypothetical protein J4E87_007094 [Alternaria ethzedia]